MNQLPCRVISSPHDNEKRILPTKITFFLKTNSWRLSCCKPTKLSYLSMSLIIHRSGRTVAISPAGWDGQMSTDYLLCLGRVKLKPLCLLAFDPSVPPRVMRHCAAQACPSGSIKFSLISSVNVCQQLLKSLGLSPGDWTLPEVKFIFFYFFPQRPSQWFGLLLRLLSLRLLRKSCVLWYWLALPNLCCFGWIPLWFFYSENQCSDFLVL